MNTFDFWSNIITILSVSAFLIKIVYQDIQTLVAKIADWLI